MKNQLLLSLLLAIGTLSFNLTNSVDYWKVLRKLKYDVKFNPDTEMLDKTPIIGEEIECLEGKKMKLEGYILPVDFEGCAAVLCVYPFDAFCCKMDHLETIIALDSEAPIRAGMDDKVVVEGVFKLNDSSKRKVIYVLEKAKCLSGCALVLTD